MQTIFENLGFRIGGEADVYKLADFVLNSGRILPGKDGAYAFWTDPSGAEVWLRLAHDHEKKRSELLNIDPHYHGGTVWRLRVREELAGEADDFMDGKFILETLDGSHFFAARIMGLRALRDFKVGGEYYFQLSMIPHGIRYFESEEAYRTYYNDEKTVLGAMFPRGVISRRVGGEGIKREEILMTGMVCHVSHAEVKNIEAADGESKRGWYWLMKAETMLGTIDIPAAAEEETVEHARRCLEAEDPVISVFGTIGALVVLPKEE